jgi:hypothetical protein
LRKREVIEATSLSGFSEGSGKVDNVLKRPVDDQMGDVNNPPDKRSRATAVAGKEVEGDVSSIRIYKL